MNPEDVRRWYEGMKEVNRITDEEERNRTPEERLRLFHLFTNQLIALGLYEKIESDHEFHTIWNDFRVRLYEAQRNSA